MELLEYASARLVAQLAAPRHSETCFSSCYECLRHYGNRFSHPALDWRLGADLLRLLLGFDPPLSITGGYWNFVSYKRTLQRLKDFGLTDAEPELIGEYLLIRSKRLRGGVIPLHPLVNREFVDIAQLSDELANKAGVPITFCCPYDLERQPLAEIQRIRQSHSEGRG